MLALKPELVVTRAQVEFNAHLESFEKADTMATGL